MDAAHRQILSSTAALVPFIEKTRVDRALTGSNMQAPGGSAIVSESATVGTGIEKAVAENSGHLIQASADGESFALMPTKFTSNMLTA